MTDSIRLAKRLAALVSCSRREAEQYIEGGWVTVDGQVVEEPGFRVGQQAIALLPDATLAPLEPVTLLLNKPAGVAGDADVEGALGLLRPDTIAEDERSGMRVLRRHFTALTLATPLATQASGLMVYTQDWRILRTLVKDAARIEQEFIVEVAGTITPGGLAAINAGSALAGPPLAGIKASWQNETRLRFALKSPQAHRIGALCAAVGLEVVALRRIRIGRIPLSALATGRWRYLTGYERF